MMAKKDRAGLVGKGRKQARLLQSSSCPPIWTRFTTSAVPTGDVSNAVRNGNIATRCYGYATIAATREDELYRKFGVEEWDRLSGDRQRIRGIVKELIHDGDRMTHKVAKKILRDLRKMGIYPMDVRARNCKAGLLVDMSIAITTPHYLFKIRHPWQLSVL